MPLSFTEKAALKLRGLPAARIEKALEIAESAGLPVTQADLCAHLLCNGSIEKAIEALELARKEGIPASWQDVCVVDLAGKDVVAAVKQAAQVREIVFSTFAADMKEPICGFCRDGSRVSAECRISYHLPLSHVFGSRLDFLQERLAARIGAYVFDATSFVRLQMSRTEHEASLLVLAKSVMPAVITLELKYATIP